MCGLLAVATCSDPAELHPVPGSESAATMQPEDDERAVDLLLEGDRPGRRDRPGRCDTIAKVEVRRVERGTIPRVPLTPTQLFRSVATPRSC